MAKRLSPERQFYNEAKTVSPPFWMAVGFGLGILFMALLKNLETDFVADFIRGMTPENLAPEVVGIIFTVTVIDYFNRQRDNRTLKAQLIREMGNTDNGIAVRAVNELRAHGWLADGSLKGATLWLANLTEADLREANLEHANMHRAILKGADVQEASLAGADLQWADLSGALFAEATLEGANLEWANLTGASLMYSDLAGANLRGANLDGAEVWDFDNYITVDGKPSYWGEPYCDETTILPDGKHWTPDINWAQYTNVEPPEPWEPGSRK